jgi:hypothetical protein
MTRDAQQPKEVFRPFWLLPILMAVAGALWTGVLLYLLTFDGIPVQTLLAAGGFALFFGLALLYYGRSAVLVDAAGVTWRGMVTQSRVRWEEIRRLHVLPGPITVYAVRTPRRMWHFTSFFRHHRRLAELLVERAGLAGARA